MKKLYAMRLVSPNACSFRYEGAELPFSLILAPLVITGAVYLFVSARGGYEWYRALPEKYLPLWKGFASCECHEYTRSLPLGKKGLESTANFGLVLGLCWSTWLVGIRLDGGSLGLGGCLTPLTLAEFFLFSLSMSQCLISECVDPYYSTIFSSGYLNRVTLALCCVVDVFSACSWRTVDIYDSHEHISSCSLTSCDHWQIMWLMPPIATSQFMLLAQVTHRDRNHENLFPWYAVFVPWLIGMALWVLGKCYLLQ